MLCKGYFLNQHLVNMVQFLSREVLCHLYVIVRFVNFLLPLCYYASPIKQSGTMISNGGSRSKSGEENS